MSNSKALVPVDNNKIIANTNNNNNNSNQIVVTTKNEQRKNRARDALLFTLAGGLINSYLNSGNNNVVTAPVPTKSETAYEISKASAQGVLDQIKIVGWPQTIGGATVFGLNLMAPGSGYLLICGSCCFTLSCYNCYRYDH